MLDIEYEFVLGRKNKISKRHRDVLKMQSE